MPGNPQIYPIALSSDEVKQLKAIASSQTAQVRHQQRAKILLLRLSGASYSQIEKEVGVSTPTISKTIKKCSEKGMQAALEDLERSGRPPVITREAKTWIVSLACQMPESLDGAPKTQTWTITALTNYVRAHCEAHDLSMLVGIQRSTIWEILNEKDIKPHRIKYYLEKKDPEFEEKAKNVLLVYKRSEWIMQWTKDQQGEGYRADELCGEAFISYDEKPGIQAISKIAPDLLPSEKHGCLARDYEYKRHGTISLLAGIDLFTGEVIGLVRDKHKSSDFIDFLNRLHSHYNKNLKINIILDNHSIHRSKETMNYLSMMPQGRFNFIFTPKHASWLNLIESFFSKMARQMLRHLRVNSKQDLINRIEDWLKEINSERVIFRWKWKLEDIENAFLPKSEKAV